MFRMDSDFRILNFHRTLFGNSESSEFGARPFLTLRIEINCIVCVGSECRVQSLYHQTKLQNWKYIYPTVIMSGCNAT